MALLRPITIDVVVASAFGAAALVGAVVEDIDVAAGVVRPLDAVAVLLIVGMTLPLVARRLLPRTVAIATVGSPTTWQPTCNRPSTGSCRSH